MGSYYQGPGPGGNNNVLVINAHATGQDVPVVIENGPDGVPIPVVPAPNPTIASSVNWVQEAIAAGVANVTLIPSTAPGPTPGNFSSLTALNSTTTDFTVQVGATNTSTFTVRAGETISLPVAASAVTAHFTAAGQHVVVVQQNTSTT